MQSCTVTVDVIYLGEKRFYALIITFNDALYKKKRTELNL